MEKKIFNYVKGIAAKKGVEIDEDSNLYNAGVLDSLDIITLLTFLQEEFNITFTPEDMNYEYYKNVHSIIAWAKRMSNS